MATKIRIWLSLFFLSLFISPCLANFTNTGLYGGDIPALLIYPADSSIIFASQRFGGLFRSSDGGNTWQPVDEFKNMSIGDLAIHPGNDQILYAGASDGQGLYKSFDGGTSWTKLNFGSSEPGSKMIHTITVTSNGNVFVGTGSSESGGWIYRSTDGGENWEEVERFSSLHRIVNDIAPFSNSLIWAVIGDEESNETGKVYLSQDGGDTWNEKGSGQFTGWLVSISVKDINTAFIAGENGLYKTQDMGTTWSQVLPASVKPALGQAIDPLASSTIFVGAKGPGYYRLYKSTQSGVPGTWLTQVEIQGVHNLRSLVIDPNDNSIIYGGDNGNGIYKSIDGGANWTSISQGLTGMAVFKLEADSSGLYAATVGGVYYTQGTVWQPIHTSEGRSDALTVVSSNLFYAGFKTGNVYKYEWTGSSYSVTKTNLDAVNTEKEIIYDLATDPSDSDILYAVSGSYDGTSGHLFKTADGGTSWSSVKQFLSSANTVRINSASIYIGTGDFWQGKSLGGLWFYKNGEWSRLIKGEIIRDIAIDRVNSSLIYLAVGGKDAGVYQGIYKTLDAGNNWQECSGLPSTGEPFTSVFIDLDRPQTVYGADLSTFYSSLNEGSSWTSVGANAQQVFDITGQQSDVYIATNQGVLKLDGFPAISGAGIRIYNFPNPFDLTVQSFTSLKYSISRDAQDVKVGIYTLTGKLVKEWKEGEREGSYSYLIPWDGKNEKEKTVSSGIYIIIVDADGKRARNKMAVVK